MTALAAGAAAWHFSATCSGTTALAPPGESGVKITPDLRTIGMLAFRRTARLLAASGSSSGRVGIARCIGIIPPFPPSTYILFLHFSMIELVSKYHNVRYADYRYYIDVWSM